MPTLYVGFDVFFPGVYDPEAVNPNGDFYIVLQPVIFEGTDPDSIALDAYFKLSGADLGRTIDVKPITRDVADRLGKTNSWALVPFPPETTIQFKKIAWDGIAAPIQIPVNGTVRIIGGITTADHTFTSPFLLERSKWPHFAVVNNMPTVIDSWAKLDLKTQQRVALGWVAAATGKIVHQKAVGTPPLSPLEDKIYSLLVTGGLGGAKVLTDDDIRTILTKPPSVLAGQIYDLFLAASEVNYQPQRFSYTEDALLKDQSPLFGDLENGKSAVVSLSYHYRLWNLFAKKIADLEKSAPSDPHAADPVRLALRRLFGFGERLYWPRQDDESFMRCGDPESQGWICTNVHSLLGQCFGFALPLDAKLKNFSLDFEVQSQAVSVSPLVNGMAASAMQTGMLEGAQNALVDWYTATPRQNISVGLTPDPDYDAGFFLFQPKMSACTKDAISDNTKTVYAIPSVLLDAVDPTARWEQPSDGSQLARVSAPRTGLFRPEIFQGKTLLPDAGSLYIPYLRLRVTLRRVTPPFLSAGDAYEVMLATPPSDVEKPAITALFKNISNLVNQASAARPAPTLLIAPPKQDPVRWVITADRLVQADPPSPDMTFVLADPDLSLNKLVSPSGDSANTDHMTSDLLLALDPKNTDATPFNLLVLDGGSDPGQMIILDGVFTSKLNRSTDRLQERVGVSLSPWPTDPTAPQQYVASHLTNFNLLRMSLSSSDPTVVSLAPPDDPEGAVVTKGGSPKALFNLTITDAIAPLPPPKTNPPPPPWEAAWPPNGGPPQFGYFLSQIFTQDMRGSSGSEALRYVNYLTPQIEWNLEGGVAHQYGQVLPVSETSALTLPLTTDISHPGLAVRRNTEADATKPPSAFLTWLPPTNSSGALQLLFPTVYLSLVNNSGDTSGGSDGAGALSNSPARYRAIYEPLADFLICLDNADTETRGSSPRAVSGLTLRLEGWVFDGNAAADARLNPDSSVDEPPPVIINNTINNMRMLAATELVVTPAVLASQASNGPQLQKLRDLLKHPFGAFIDQVGQFVKDNAKDWVTLNLPSDTWTSGGVRLDPEELIAKADLVRLGLALIRPKATVVASPNPMIPGFGMGANKPIRAARKVETKTRSMKLLATTGDFSDLEPAAATELARYLDDKSGATSALRRRFAWLRLRDGGTTSMMTLPSAGAPAVSVATLVGDVAPFVTMRGDVRPNTDTVLTLRYVPVAFRPLAPDARVGDTAAVEEFVAFLLAIVSDITAGNTPSGVRISDQAGVRDVEKFYNLRAKVLTLYRDGANPVSALLTSLIDYVEWKDPNNPTLKWIREQAELTLTGPDGGWRRAISILLDQQPNLYAAAQGFAVAMVDQTSGRESWDDGLMSLQIIKTVPALDLSGTGKVDNNAILDRIVFTRIHGRKSVPFFIDTFDTARYHDEFWIDRNTYAPATPKATPTDPVKFSDGFSLLSRGDVEARTADDFLRGRNPFDNPLVKGLTGTPRRGLEAEVVPYNNVWQQSESGQPANRGIYLLPARKFPDSPTVMIPIALSPNDGSAPVWRTPMNLSFSQGTPPDLIALYWTNLTSQVLTPTVTFAGASAGATIQASHPQHQFPSTKPAESQVPAGWWFLDTYATHHHFKVSPDPTDPTFKRDSFRIEVDRSGAPFPLDPETPGVMTPKPTPLLAWFQYQRLLDHNRSSGVQPAPQGSITPPPPIASDSLVDELATWLSADSGVLRAIDAKPPVVMNAFTYVPSAEGSPNLHPPIPGQPPSIGDVIAVDMLWLGDNGASGYVLRVIVLDDVWNYSRVRVTHLRNETTVGGDPEFSPLFAMESPVSAWNAFGRQPLAVDFTSSELQKRNLPQGVASLRAGRTVNAYLDATGPVSYGSALSNACLATFKAASGKSWTMWNSSELTNVGFTVRGTLMHERLDLHPRFNLVSPKTLPAAAVLERNEDIPRQFLPAGAAGDVTANNIDALAQNISRDQVPGVHQKLRVAWYNAKGEEIVTAIWPVMFDV